MKNIILIFSIIISSFLINSCEGAYDFDTENLSTKVELSPDIAIPLIDASITLEEIMPESDEVESFLIIDGDNFMSLYYKFDITEITIDDFFDNNPLLSGSPVPDITYAISPQIVNIGLDNFLKEGEIKLADPELKLFIKNYWPVPVSFKFNDFYYYEDETADNKTALTGSLIDSDISITSPTSAGTSETTIIDINKDNSTIVDLISAMPHHISFGASFTTLTPNSIPYDIPSSSTDSVKMELNIPFDLSLKNISMQDTIEFSFGDSDTTLIESLTLGITMDNGFPLSINSQFYFVDDNFVVLDSLFDSGFLVEAGSVDANGKVNANQSSTSQSQSSEDRIKNILKATNIIFKVILNTTDVDLGQSVKLYSDYEIGIKMGARFKLNPSF